MRAALSLLGAAVAVHVGQAVVSATSASASDHLGTQGALLPSCSVTSLGAKGDNRTEDTQAVQAALDGCATVMFPAPGRYLIRPVFLRHSDIAVVVEQGATVVAWGEIDTWNTTSPKISALFSQDPKLDPLTNFSITGGGVLDGQGWRWWPFLKTRSRPELLHLFRVQGARIDGIIFRDSPSFHVSVRGYDIEISHSRVEANMESCQGWDHAPNTDAFNIGGGNIYLHDLWVHNGDDCIPTNPGPDGYTSNVLVENVHCECGTNGGVVIVPGSRGKPPSDWQAGGPDLEPKIVANVTYRNMTVHHTNQGAGFKISEAYENVSGTAKNITWEDIEIYKPRNTAIYMNVFTEDADEKACKVPQDAELRGSHWLAAEDFVFRDIQAVTDGFPGCLLCSPTRPCLGIVFVRHSN
jgi:polygalacturonase